MALKKKENSTHKRVIKHKLILAKSLCFTVKNYKRGNLSFIAQCQKMMKKTMKIKKKLKKKEERRKKKEGKEQHKEEKRGYHKFD